MNSRNFLHIPCDLSAGFRFSDSVFISGECRFPCLALSQVIPLVPGFI